MTSSDQGLDSTWMQYGVWEGIPHGSDKGIGVVQASPGTAIVMHVLYQGQRAMLGLYPPSVLENKIV